MSGSDHVGDRDPASWRWTQSADPMSVSDHVGDPADQGLARVARLVADAASAAAIEEAVSDEARRATGAATVRIDDGGADTADGLLARAAAQGSRITIEGPVTAPIAMAAPLIPGAESTPALVVRAADGYALIPDSGEALARLALMGGVGIMGARVATRESDLVQSGMLIGQGLDLDAVLQRVVESARSVVGARYAALGVLSEDGDSLARFIWSGLDDATAMNIGRLPQGRGLLGKLITDPRPLRVERISDHPASVGFPPGHPPMRSMLGVPVMLGDQVFGNLYFTDHDDGPFTEADERIAVTLAAQAAIAIANAQAAADDRAQIRGTAEIAAARAREVATADGHRRAIRAQESERMRVARELHDETGQVLTAVALELRALEGHLDADGRDRLAAIRRTLAAASEHVRDLAERLRPSGLAEHGLESAIERQADRLRRDGAMTVDLAVQGLPDNLPDEIGIAVFRVVQEALTNVQRHSGAHSVSVLVTAVDGTMRVVVEDDGVGFDPGTATDRLGLVGIHERVALVGGKVTIESAPGQGTMMAVVIPIRAGADRLG